MKYLISILFASMLLCGVVTAEEDCMCFIRGDCNGDGVFNIADLSVIGPYLQGGYTGPIHDNLDALDTNDDGSINVADISYLGGMLVHGYAWLPPNAETGTGLDPTPDNINRTYDWSDGVSTCVFGALSHWIAAVSNVDQWPRQNAYTFNPYPHWWGGRFVVDTVEQGQYPELANEFFEQLTARKSPPSQRPFKWGAFESGGTCNTKTSLRVDYRAEHMVSAGNSIRDDGYITIESDASKAQIRIEIRNNRLAQAVFLYKEVDMGHIGIKARSYYEDPKLYQVDSSAWDAWDNDYEGTSGNSLTSQYVAMDHTHITIGDLSTPVPNWLDTDDIVVEEVRINQIYAEHDPAVQDASKYDVVDFRVAIGTVTFEVEGND